jgi:ATP-dependent DNA helicase RecG
MQPKIGFQFFEINLDDKKIVILEVKRAETHPVQFNGREYIRVGSYKKLLKDFPDKERELWRVFDKTPFESLSARENLESDEVLSLLNYPDYFDLLQMPLPDNKSGILKYLEEERMIHKSNSGLWNISNLGAILFAKKLDDFQSLKRKAVRVIVYKGKSRVETQREQVGGKGYASGFNGLIEFIKNIIPSNEVIEKAFRKTIPMYPEIAIRELYANAIIHQDFFIQGTGPMVEIFSDRIEITNPGIPLVQTDRFLDNPPRSRNESIAQFMRRIGICEERGSGIDKVVFQTEFYQLPAPLFEVVGDNTRVTLFAHRPYSGMDRKERVRATYLHACLKYVQREYLTNTSLRERFGIESKNSAMISRVIKDALEDQAIKPVDPENESRKQSRYWPEWA